VLASTLEALFAVLVQLCSLYWCWWLVLEWCERKILLAGWWLEAGAGAM